MAPPGGGEGDRWQEESDPHSFLVWDLKGGGVGGGCQLPVLWSEHKESMLALVDLVAKVRGGGRCQEGSSRSRSP